MDSPSPFAAFSPSDLEQESSEVSCIVGNGSQLLNHVKDADVLSPLNIHTVEAESPPDYISHLASPPQDLLQGPLGEEIDTSDPHLGLLDCPVTMTTDEKDERTELEPNRNVLGADDDGDGDKDTDDEEDVVVSHKPTVMLHYR